MKKIIAGLIVAALFLSLANMGVVEAETGLPDQPQMPGRVEGTGTHFELTDSKYLNIILDSSQPIKLILESVPEMVTMQLESASGAMSTQITLGGFLPSTTYHKYEDDYHNHLAFATDASGKYTYTQDLSRTHLVFIQPRASTIYLSDSGWTPSSVGTWVPATKTGTLTQDVTETIQIDSNNITLDGNGHYVTGSNTGSGVYLSGKTGVTIKNVNVKKFSYGIHLYSSSNNNTITNNTVSSNHSGIYLHSSSNNNTIKNNTANSNSYGIWVWSSLGNTVDNNTANSNWNFGIRIRYSLNNIVVNNTANSNNHSGIALEADGNNNTIKNNTANSNQSCGIYLWYSSGNTLTDNTANSNGSVGIALDRASNNNFTNNIAGSNSSAGFHIYSGGSNSLTNNTAQYSQHGIVLSYSNNNNLARNSTTNNRIGILVYYSNGNTITGSIVSYNTAGSDTYGIKVDFSSNSNIINNTMSSNVIGIGITSSSSSNNKVYNNNFISNTTQVYFTGGSGNVFNLAAPAGGNYWSNWTTSDDNDDGFVDSAYIFTGGQDNLPWAAQNGWLDKTPPTTTISLAGTSGNNGWYKSDVVVTLTATDNEGGTGVKKIKYSFDGSTWNTYSVPFNIGSEGIKTLYYKSIDKAGNNEATKTQGVKIDWSAPTLTFGTPTPEPNAAGWNNADVSIPFTRNDSVSGVASTNPATSPVVLSTEGSAVTGTVTVTDLAGNTASFTTPSFKIDKTSPTIFGSRAPAPNSNGWNNTDVTIHFEVSDTLSGIESKTPDTTISAEGAGQSVVGTATDKAGNSSSCTVSGINIDKTKPTLVFGSVTPTPNGAGWNNTTPVTIPFTPGDDLSGVASTSAASPLSFTTEGANLTQSVTVVDKAGNTATFTSPTVNLDKTPPQASSVVANPNPVSVNTAVTLTATVSDSGTVRSNIASAQYRIDNGEWMHMTAQDGAFGGVTEDVIASLGPFATTGVHNIDVRGQDGAGNYSPVQSILLAVYDPSGGFVTGGGWTNSPAGAYIANPSLTGKATFGFVSKYQKGTTAPTGVTEFQFRVASLNFHSNSYEWLVIAGAKAQYKGVGTINGTGTYGFMLTAIDGQVQGGGGVDKFRIKIWDKATGNIIYDNQLGAADDGDPTTVIGGGSIVIHKE